MAVLVDGAVYSGQAYHALWALMVGTLILEGYGLLALRRFGYLT